MPFHIMFAPLSDTAPKRAPLKKTQLGESSASAALGNETDTFKFLLVDDNVDLLEMTADLFRDAGFEVFTAFSGKEALQILESNPTIDAVLTDVVMPGMTGLELGHEVRRRYPSVKVILASGYPNPATEAGHGNVHYFSFLAKPYRMEQVIRLLVTPN
jgi:DNA-binding NtrC family response regulator